MTEVLLTPQVLAKLGPNLSRADYHACYKAAQAVTPNMMVNLIMVADDAATTAKKDKSAKKLSRAQRIAQECLKEAASHRGETVTWEHEEHWTTLAWLATVSIETFESLIDALYQGEE